MVVNGEHEDDSRSRMLGDKKIHRTKSYKCLGMMMDDKFVQLFTTSSNIVPQNSLVFLLLIKFHHLTFPGTVSESDIPLLPKSVRNSEQFLHVVLAICHQHIFHIVRLFGKRSVCVIGQLNLYCYCRLERSSLFKRTKRKRRGGREEEDEEEEASHY